MRATTNFTLALTSLLFGLLLLPQAALAQSSANCPIEPASNVPIALGEVFAGTNCNLHTNGDIDSFIFHGISGDTYQFAVAPSGGSNDICLNVYDPGFKQIFSGCTNRFGTYRSYSVVTVQKLTATGMYTIDVTEPSSGTQNYAVSLQQLFPFPLYATKVPKWEDPLPGNIAQLTDTNFFTYPVAPTGMYQVTATPIGGSNDICLYVNEPSDASAGSACTNRFGTYRSYSAVIQFQPPQNGTSLASIQVAGNDGTQTYTLEIACLVGYCPPPPPITYPPCTLSDGLSYNPTTSTLTMKFNVGNSLGTPANWSAWLTYADPQGTSLDTMQALFSMSQPTQPNTIPPKTITKTLAPLPKEGVVGVLSTLSTPKNGIACSSWVQINTGTEP